MNIKLDSRLEYLSPELILTRTKYTISALDLYIVLYYVALPKQVKCIESFTKKYIILYIVGILCAVA